MSKTTKEKILESASKIFTAYGFSGTSTVKIAKLANVSQGLIFHYFGSKENLWKEVNRVLNEDNGQAPISIPDLQLPFRYFVESLVESLLKFALTNQESLRFSAWQYLENIDCSEANIFPVKIDQLQNAFQHYQKAGEIDPGLKINFMVSFFLSVVRSAILDQDLIVHNNDQDYDQYMRFCADRIGKAFI